MNNHYGYSGWFNYSGTHQNASVMGSGDFFGDLDCTLPYQIEYDYTATDCSGNQSEFGYTVNVTGDVCDARRNRKWPCGHWKRWRRKHGRRSSQPWPTCRGDIQVSHISPNPTQDHARIGFNVQQPMRLDVKLFDAAGMYIGTLFSGSVDKGQAYTLDINASLPIGKRRVPGAHEFQQCQHREAIHGDGVIRTPRRSKRPRPIRRGRFSPDPSSLSSMAQFPPKVNKFPLSYFSCHEAFCPSSFPCSYCPCL